jgi:hypothetical protein
LARRDLRLPALSVVLVEILFLIPRLLMRLLGVSLLLVVAVADGVPMDPQRLVDQVAVVVVMV